MKDIDYERDRVLKLQSEIHRLEQENKRLKEELAKVSTQGRSGRKV